MAIAAVLFDLDETLVEEESSVDAAFLAACAIARERHGIDPRALHRAVRERARQLWRGASTIGYCRAIGISSWEGLCGRFLGDDPNLEALREWTPTYRRQAWARALADHGVEDMAFAERLAEAFREERRSRHVLFPDTEPTLTDLRRTHRLALVTNGAPDLQREKIRGAKLAPYFDATVVSGEVGVGKPDPRVFTLALDQLSVPPETAVMVGDSLSRDVVGAQQVGLRAVWVNRSGADPGDDARPDAQVADLRELRKVLERVAW